MPLRYRSSSHALAGRFGAALLAFGLLAGSSCSSSSDTPANPQGTGGGGGGVVPLAPNWPSIWINVIRKYDCTSTQCHGASSAGGLRLDDKAGAYQNLVGQEATGQCIEGGSDGAATVCGCAPKNLTRVIPGDPDNSLLVMKLSGSPPCGERMPPASAPIPSTTLDVVKEWIQKGAPETN
jgi:hypothetical protein